MVARGFARMVLATVAVGLASTGCASMRAGSGPPPGMVADGRWLVAPAVRLRLQDDDRGCGPAALAMIFERWGADPRLATPSGRPSGAGTTAGELRDTARRLGFQAFALFGTEEDMAVELSAGRPLLLGLARRNMLQEYSHFVVLVGLDRDTRRLLVADPDRGWMTLDRTEWMQEWSAARRVIVVVHPSAPLQKSTHLKSARPSQGPDEQGIEAPKGSARTAVARSY